MKNEKGSIVIIVAILLPVIMVGSVLIMDIANMYYVKRQAQVMADASASAGATGFEGWTVDPDSGETVANINPDKGRGYMEDTIDHYHDLYDIGRRDIAEDHVGWRGVLPQKSEEHPYDYSYIKSKATDSSPIDTFSVAIKMDAPTLLLGGIIGLVNGDTDNTSRFTLWVTASVKAELTH